MSADADLWFAKECAGPFQFLTTRYGFEGPLASRAGNEFTVCYTKKNKTIAVVIEPGSRPVVEFFFPSQDMAHRSFPKHRSLPALGMKSEEESISCDLLYWAVEIETQNLDFITD